MGLHLLLHRAAGLRHRLLRLHVLLRRPRDHILGLFGHRHRHAHDGVRHVGGDQRIPHPGQRLLLGGAAGAAPPRRLGRLVRGLGVPGGFLLRDRAQRVPVGAVGGHHGVVGHGRRAGRRLPAQRRRDRGRDGGPVRAALLHQHRQHQVAGPAEHPGRLVPGLLHRRHRGDAAGHLPAQAELLLRLHPLREGPRRGHPLRAAGGAAGPALLPVHSHGIRGGLARGGGGDDGRHGRAAGHDPLRLHHCRCRDRAVARHDVLYPAPGPHAQRGHGHWWRQHFCWQPDLLRRLLRQVRPRLRRGHRLHGPGGHLPLFRQHHQRHAHCQNGVRHGPRRRPPLLQAVGAAQPGEPHPHQRHRAHRHRLLPVHAAQPGQQRRLHRHHRHVHHHRLRALHRHPAVPPPLQKRIRVGALLPGPLERLHRRLGRAVGRRHVHPLLLPALLPGHRQHLQLRARQHGGMHPVRDRLLVHGGQDAVSRAQARGGPAGCQGGRLGGSPQQRLSLMMNSRDNCY